MQRSNNRKEVNNERHDLNRVINLKPSTNARKQQSTRKGKQSPPHESATGIPSGPEWEWCAFGTPNGSMNASYRMKMIWKTKRLALIIK